MDCSRCREMQPTSSTPNPHPVSVQNSCALCGICYPHVALTTRACPSLSPAREGVIVSSVNEVNGDGKAEAAELLAEMVPIRRVTRRAVRNAAHAEPLPPARPELL